MPLEHCLYYAGVLYSICEQENFLVSGVKEAKDAQYVKTVGKSAVASRGAPVAARGAGSVGQGGAASGRGGAATGRGGPGNQGRTRGPPKSGAGGHAQKIVQASIGSSNSGWRSETSQWYTLINKLSKKNLLPVCMLQA